MKKEEAEKLLAYIESECCSKVEQAIKDHLDVYASLRFEISKGHGGFYVKGVDALADTFMQMTATPLLRQLFRMAWIEVTTWEFEKEVGFTISVRYEHEFQSGSNGRDLMRVVIRKDTGEVVINK